MRRRGRPKKVKLSDDEMLESLIFKLYNFYLDGEGNIKVRRNDAVLTLEETAFMIWNAEGRKTAKPLSKMMMLNVERNALSKMKDGLAKVGIKSFDDVFGAKHRTAATMVSNYGSTDCPE